MTPRALVHVEASRDLREIGLAVACRANSYGGHRYTAVAMVWRWTVAVSFWRRR